MSEENKDEQPAQPQGEKPVTPEVVVPQGEKDERNWAMFCHLSAMAGILGIPFGNVVGPLIVWSLKKSEMPLVNREGVESLNFQISMVIYSLVAFMLCFVAIGFFLLVPLYLLNFVLVIIASVKVSKGEHYEYPFTIRFIK